VNVPDARTLLFGRETIDLAAVEQLMSRGQIRAIGRALALVATRHLDAGRSITDILDAVEAAVSESGLDVLDSRRVGDLAAFRRFELAAALNRVRSLRID